MGSPLDVERLRQEILGWMTPPSADRGGRVAGRQIRRLVGALEQPSAREDLFLSTVAEAVLARRLLEAGCRIEIERATAHGRHADFFVRRGDVELWIHVKRIGLPPDEEPHPALPAELAALESIARPVAMAVRWSPAADAAALRTLADELGAFVRQASVGDELVVRSEVGAWLGAARIAAPGTAGHVTLRTGADAGWEAAVPRVQRLLRKAHLQFMPGGVNAVCVASDTAAAHDAVETALLGTVIERWDRFPPRGHRVAHGRAEDGFWSGGQCGTSALVGWFPLDGAVPARLWERWPPGGGSERERRAAELLREVLHAGSEP